MSVEILLVFFVVVSAVAAINVRLVIAMTKWYIRTIEPRGCQQDSLSCREVLLAGTPSANDQ